jgi:ribosomal RNA-processing protein 1
MVADVMPTSHARSLGLSYHLADVWLPELRKVCGQDPLPAEALQALLEPFVAVMQLSGEAALVNRVRWVGGWFTL